MKNCSFAAANFLGPDYGKRGPIEELQLCCCKFLGPVTVREVQLKNCSFAAANFLGPDYGKRGPIEELQLCCCKFFGARLR